MTESTDASTAPAPLFDTWMKSVNDLWASMATPFPLSGKTDDTKESGKEKTRDADFLKTGNRSLIQVISWKKQAFRLI